MMLKRPTQSCGKQSQELRLAPTGRRQLLAGWASSLLLVTSSAQARTEPINKEVDAADSPFIQELLRRTEENKERRYKERLNDYYKRNFKDYFEFEAGNAQTGRARGLSAESQQAIAQWLKENEDVTFPAQRRQQEQEQP